MLPHPGCIFFICSVILTAPRREVGSGLRQVGLGQWPWLCALAGAILMLVGCAVAPTPVSRGAGADLALAAIGQVGVPYRHGGGDPASGFDCSGLVRFVAREVLGVDLPRHAKAIGRIGVDVDPESLEPGDLVFFNTLGRPYSHVGVYVGNGEFVHAPTRGGSVRIERLTQAYWRARFDGARRLETIAGGTARSVRTGVGMSAATSSGPRYRAGEP
jgi:hypothetical protein